MSVPTSPSRGNPAHPVPAGARCRHCGAPVEAEDPYCCHGCALAAEIIRGAGLERYYQERTEWAPRPEPEAGDWSAVPVSRDAAGRAEARLAIDGLRCASCVWVTEHLLQRTPGVEAATVSYATGRATLRWDPARVDLPALARRIAALGYRPRPLAEERTPDRGLLLRLGVSAFLALNIMLLAATLYAGWWDGMEPGYAALFRWTSLVLATPIALWCAQPFLAGAWTGLRAGVLAMDLPVALGVLILFGHGLVATLLGHDGYLDSMAMLVTLLLGGRVLEAGGRRRAAEASAALAGSLPRTARRVRPGTDPGTDRVESVPVQDLAAGDLVDLGSGDEAPADGVVVEGTGQVRLALVTGEANPVPVAPGDRLVAGAVLLDGALTLRVEAVGEGTLVRRMAAQLAQAQDRGVEPRTADRIAPWFTAATLGIAALTGAGWWLAAGLDPAITRTVAVLVVACPCALALSHPLAAAAGLGASARRGLLVRSSDALLRLGRADLAALDKTGTVTAGALEVVQADDATLRIAAGLERYSGHPIARAITREAARRGIPLPRASQTSETPGLGVRGTVDGVHWQVLSGGALTVVLQAEGDRVPAGRIQLGDMIREDAARTVATLRQLGVEPVLLSGDHPDVAERIAAEAGIGATLAEVGPEAKADWIRARQAEGRRVLFAGDGLNDGPALAAADVGIAMAGGATSSILVADGIVSTASLGPVVAGIRAGRVAERTIRVSQRWSIGYNVLAVGAAAAGWINPLVAAVLMPLSSVTVIWNAMGVERALRRLER